MRKLFFLLSVSSIATSLYAQQTKPVSSTPVGDSALLRKRDSAKQKDYLVITMKEVLITSVSLSKVAEGTPASATLTKENITTQIKAVKIETGKLITTDGYQFIAAKGEKSLSLQKTSNTGLVSIAGTFEYTCFGSPNSCKVTVTDSRTISLSTGCVGCSLVATINNTKYLVRLN
jgi:hypothetical protein